MRGKITILFVTITQTKDVTSTNAPNANDSNSQDANLRLIVLLIVRQISIVPIPEPDLFICADTLYMLPYTSTLTTYMTRPRLSVWSSAGK